MNSGDYYGDNFYKKDENIGSVCFQDIFIPNALCEFDMLNVKSINDLTMDENSKIKIYNLKNCKEVFKIVEDRTWIDDLANEEIIKGEVMDLLKIKNIIKNNYKHNDNALKLLEKIIY